MLFSYWSLVDCPKICVFRIFKISTYLCLHADVEEYLLFIPINQCDILSHAAICRGFLMEWLMGSAEWTVRSNAMVRYDGINRKRAPRTWKLKDDGGGRSVVEENPGCGMTGMILLRRLKMWLVR
jgi:hypothetical protein